MGCKSNRYGLALSARGEVGPGRLDAVAAVALGFVQGGIGRRQDLGRLPGAQMGHPYADGNAHDTRGSRNVAALEHGPDALGHLPASRATNWLM